VIILVIENITSSILLERSLGMSAGFVLNS